MAYVLVYHTNAPKNTRSFAVKPVTWLRFILAFERFMRSFTVYFCELLLLLFFQLKKELSDALLAAEHERNNFRNEVRFVKNGFST